MMEKSERLEVLEQLGSWYSRAIEFGNTNVTRNDFYEYLDGHNLDGGLCLSLLNFVDFEEMLLIKDELIKESPIKFTKIHWVTPPYMIRKKQEIIDEALWPRLSIINRTILRLQNELNAA